MIKFIQWLIFGHVHKWSIIGQSRWELYNPSNKSEIVRSGPRFVCRCEKCGIYKVFDL